MAWAGMNAISIARTREEKGGMGERKREKERQKACRTVVNERLCAQKAVLSLSLFLELRLLLLLLSILLAILLLRSFGDSRKRIFAARFS